jgi:pimeloyl-ACP methyl ester carboxylesterase
VSQVDVIVVYKVDRLTRSLADFAKLVELFDALGVSFISVTQAFNTTTSMGRLTLNMLLSFAQFEREITGERIRDKVSASKRKGIWMGGAVPFGYDKNRRDFAKVIWQLASPKWEFDDATFDRSAAAFDNPDHVAIVIHNYRWRLALAEGEPMYDDLEKRLATGPIISVPTITLEGDANGAPHSDPSAYAKKFSGKYASRIIKGGVGHNLPQEAPQVFAAAVIDIAQS